MFSVVAAVAMTVIGQNQYPIHQYPISILQQSVYHDIHFPDVVKTRVDVKAVMPDGSSFSVPIINGYKPEISIKNTPSYVRRTFTYKNRRKWSGDTELLYVKSKPKAKPKPKPRPKPEPVLKLAAPTNSKPKPPEKVASVKVIEIKRLPSSIKSKEADFTKKFPRY